MLVAVVVAETVRSNVPLASTDNPGLMLVVNPTTDVGGVSVAAPLNAAPVSFRLIVCAAPPFWIASGLLASFRKMLVDTICGAITSTPSTAGCVTPWFVPLNVAAKAPTGVASDAAMVNVWVEFLIPAAGGVYVTPDPPDGVTVIGNGVVPMVVTWTVTFWLLPGNMFCGASGVCTTTTKSATSKPTLSESSAVLACGIAVV